MFKPVFDMDCEAGWDVSKESERLNSSLFGVSKKTIKPKGSHNGDNASSGKGSSRVIADSDDETFTKKDVKRMKNKRRKDKTKGQDAKSEAGISNVQEKDAKKKIKRKNKEHDTGNEKTDTDSVKAVKKNKKDGSNVQNFAKKRKNKNEEVKEQDDDLKKIKKRKRNSTEKETDEESQAPKRKKSKNSKTETPDTSLKSNESSEETAKKKRNRNRKKKNNSKKNKYAHLALNKDKEHIENGTGKGTTSSAVSEVEVSKDAKIKTNGDGNLLINPSIKKASKTNARAEMQQKNVSVPATKKTAATKNNEPCNSPVALNSLKKKAEKRKEDTNEGSKKKKIKKEAETVVSEKLHALLAPKTSPKEKNDLKKTKIKKKAIKSEKTKTSTAEGEKCKQNLNKTNGVVNSEFQQELLQKQKKLLKALSQSMTENEKSKEDPEQSKRMKAIENNKKKNDLNDSNKNNISMDNVKKMKDGVRGQQSKKSDLPKAARKTIEVQSSLSTDANTPVASNKSIWGNKNINLASQAREKLNAARFRYLNEQLYTCEGKEALQMFKKDREAFEVYHAGFENQASKWPVNPVDIIIKQLKEKSEDLIIADFGCGDAKLAQTLPQKVHSFDLVALNPRVTACDMTKVPLPKESVDIAVFCLSLMGTNLEDYIKEANWVLKSGGLLKIVEVVSRFKGLSSFLAGVCSLGFQLLNKRDLGDMFYMMDFRKVKSIKKGSTSKGISLKPCVYKRR